jgi:hypothetical protein
MTDYRHEQIMDLYVQKKLLQAQVEDLYADGGDEEGEALLNSELAEVRNRLYDCETQEDG